MAEHDELFQTMKELIVSRLEIPEEKVTMDASIRRDFNADSLDVYELVFQLEEITQVKIPDEKANEFETVRDVYDFIKAQQGQKK